MKQSQQSIQSKSHPVVPVAAPSFVDSAIRLYIEWTGAIETKEPQKKKAAKKKGDPTMRFMGADMAQNWPDLLIWEMMFNEYPLRSFIELGTGHGGMSLFFGLQCYQRGIEFHTFDNQRPEHFKEPLAQCIGLEQRFHFVDIFKEGKEEIVSLIANMPKPLGIFFDDGDKPREWATYAPLTVKGDILAVHDWGTEFKEADIGGVPVVRILGGLSDKRPSGWKAMWFQRT